MDAQLDGFIGLFSFFALGGLSLIISSIFKAEVTLPIIGVVLPRPDSSKQCRVRYALGIPCLLVGVLGLLFMSGFIHGPTQEVILLDSMDSTNGWEEFATNDSLIYENSEYGYKNNAINVTYSLGNGNASSTYVEIYKDLPFSEISKDIDKINAIRFWYRAWGNVNTIELQLIDNTGRKFWYYWPGSTSAANWTYQEVQVKDFKCDDQGGVECNDTVNLIKITQIRLLVYGGEGGTGNLIIDEIEGVVPSHSFLFG